MQPDSDSEVRNWQSMLDLPDTQIDETQFDYHLDMDDDTSCADKINDDVCPGSDADSITNICKRRRSSHDSETCEEPIQPHPRRDETRDVCPGTTDSQIGTPGTVYIDECSNSMLPEIIDVDCVSSCMSGEENACNTGSGICRDCELMLENEKRCEAYNL